jgi:hypothetical protein
MKMVCRTGIPRRKDLDEWHLNTENLFSSIWRQAGQGDFRIGSMACPGPFFMPYDIPLPEIIAEAEAHFSNAFARDVLPKLGL